MTLVYCSGCRIHRWKGDALRYFCQTNFTYYYSRMIFGHDEVTHCWHAYLHFAHKTDTNKVKTHNRQSADCSLKKKKHFSRACFFSISKLASHFFHLQKTHFYPYTILSWHQKHHYLPWFYHLIIAVLWYSHKTFRKG